MKLEFLISYLEGNAAPEVKQAVRDWMDECRENAEYLTKVQKVWFAVDELKALSAIDVNKDWRMVEQRLRSKTSVGRQRSVWSVATRGWLRIAAVFVLGVMLSATIFYLANRHAQTPEIAGDYYEVTVPDGQKSNLVLPDGTAILVNAGSKLRLPKGNNSRLREVWIDGEAFFKVAKDAAHPFIVHTPEINVQVLGTTFNVRAYSDEGLTETTLVEGKVMLGTSNGKPEVALTPNRKAIFIRDHAVGISASLRREFGDRPQVGQILVSEPIDPASATAWVNGRMIFDNEYFEVVANRLSRYYGLRITITDEKLKSIRYSGSIKNISLEQVLRALQVTAPFHYCINDTEVVITN